MTIAFTIPGPPVPKGRPRMGKWGAFTPAPTKAYERTVKHYAHLAMGRLLLLPMTGAVAMTIRFFVPDARRRDLDNLCKAVTDAGNGVLYADDSQIEALHLTRAIDRTNPRAEVELRSVAA